MAARRAPQPVPKRLDGDIQRDAGSIQRCSVVAGIAEGDDGEGFLWEIVGSVAGSVHGTLA